MQYRLCLRFTQVNKTSRNQRPHKTTVTESLVSLSLESYVAVHSSAFYALLSIRNDHSWGSTRDTGNGHTRLVAFDNGASLRHCNQRTVGTLIVSLKPDDLNHRPRFFAPLYTNAPSFHLIPFFLFSSSPQLFLLPAPPPSLFISQSDTMKINAIKDPTVSYSCDHVTMCSNRPLGRPGYPGVLEIS